MAIEIPSTDNARDEFEEGLLYRPVKDRALAPDRCFLCGLTLDRDSKSAEHVFPQWLLRKYQISNQRMALLNGESITYSRLKIACCKPCNNTWLSKVENQIKPALESGIDAIRSLDRRVLFAWLAKIYYGILFRELSLRVDVNDPASPAILPVEIFERLEMHHQLLQSIRFETEFSGDVPWSIVIVECQAGVEISQDFDFLDSLGGMCLGIRMGSVGILACLQDNNAMESTMSDYFLKFDGHRLHGLQFQELFAHIVYGQKLLNRVPKYLVQLPTVDDSRMHIIGLPLQGLSGLPIYGEWKQREFAAYLSAFTHQPLELIFEEPDQVMTWLFDREGNFNELNVTDSVDY